MNSVYLKLVGSKLQLQGQNLSRKGIPSQKRKKWTAHTTEFCIFKLVLIPNFNLNWKFWFSGPSLPKMGISSLNQKKMNTTIKFCIFKSVYVPNLSLNWKFLYFWQICPTKYLQLKDEKVNITNEFWIFELVPIPYFSLNW